MRVNVRSIRSIITVLMFVIFAMGVTSTQAQGVFMAPSVDGRLTVNISTNGTLVAGTYTPPCGCRAEVTLTRTPENTIHLEATTVWCLAKGLEGRGGEMLPSVVMYDRNQEVEAVRGKDGIYRASIQDPALRFNDIFVFLVPKSTTAFDFSRVPGQSYGIRKTMVPILGPTPIPVTPLTSTPSAQLQ